MSYTVTGDCHLHRIHEESYERLCEHDCTWGGLFAPGSSRRRGTPPLIYISQLAHISVFLCRFLSADIQISEPIIGPEFLEKVCESFKVIVSSLKLVVSS
jgi:hypothetical protein